MRCEKLVAEFAPLHAVLIRHEQVLLAQAQQSAGHARGGASLKAAPAKYTPLDDCYWGEADIAEMDRCRG
jgi:hypothetical protein